MAELLTKFDLVEPYCAATGKYAVVIQTHFHAAEDTASSVAEEGKAIVKNATYLEYNLGKHSEFPINKCIQAIIGGGIIICDSELEAQSYFERTHGDDSGVQDHPIYAAMYGPDGFIQENT